MCTLAMCFPDARFFLLSIKIKMIFAILTHSRARAVCSGVYNKSHFVAFYLHTSCCVCVCVCYVLITHVHSIHYILKIKHNLLAIWNLYLRSHTHKFPYIHASRLTYKLFAFAKQLQCCRCSAVTVLYSNDCCCQRKWSHSLRIHFTCIQHITTTDKIDIEIVVKMWRSFFCLRHLNKFAWKCTSAFSNCALKLLFCNFIWS